MSLIRRITFSDLLQILIAAGLCISLTLSCISEKEKAKKPTPVSSAGEAVPTSSLKRTVKHDLTIIHPGDPKSEPMDLELVQYLDDNGNPEKYSLWVDSVICRDKTCEVVQVEIFWDAFGRYQQYFVEKGSDLTKLDHIPFSKEDHAKLQRILKDKESPLREVTKDGLVGQKAKSAVDGVAGATVLTLSSTVVIGAGYTCYDLWHWANGEVVNIIRGLSGKSTSVAKLQEYLSSDEEESVLFAISKLKERKVFDSQTKAKIIDSMKGGSDELIAPAIDYLNESSQNTEEYFSSLARIYENCSSKKRVYITTALSKETRSISYSLCDRLSAKISELESYHEVHLLLTLFEQRKVWSKLIETNAVKLLDHPKFFFSRRAYWFLKKQKLSPEVQSKVDAFFKKHQLRLL